MKITAVFCVYNEKEYLEWAVRSILPAVERVIILLGTAPYNAYNPDARNMSRPDGTETIVDRLAAADPKITVVKGIWESEVEHRNAGLKLCLEDGTDYYWLVDGDEFYREDHVRNIRRGIEQHPEAGTFIIKCHIFWRSFRYRIPAQEMSWRPRRIFKMTRWRTILGIRFPHRLRFTGQNETNSIGMVYEFPPEEAVFYHFSYARSSDAMKDKFKTFSHAHEIKEDWVANVWEKWPTDRQMQNIHPVDPPKFPRALLREPDDLPAILKEHPYYALDIIP
ncbi:MAG: glycosyltransferase family 2 protein [Candidatus Omnitrophica bacterium]|nr:glycosyltransferase family 2 protein [Candidatus Omnitrophota bacterium]